MYTKDEYRILIKAQDTDLTLSKTKFIKHYKKNHFIKVFMGLIYLVMDSKISR